MFIKVLLFLVLQVFQIFAHPPIMFDKIHASRDNSAAVAYIRTISKRDGNSEHLDIYVRSDKKNFPLRLAPVETIFAPEKVFIADARGVNEINEPKENFAVRNLYTDERREAALIVDRDNDNVVLEGIIDEDYRIEPSASRKRNANGEVEHLIFNREYPTNGFGDAVIPEVDDSIISRYESNFNSRQAVNPNVLAEVLIVVDYSNTEKMKKDRNAIIRYLSVFFYAVNRPYTLISNPTFALNVTGVILTTDVSQESWVNKTEDDEVALSTPTLNGFGRWLSTQDINVSCDLAYWLTNLDLADEIDNETEYGVTGVAYAASACEITPKKYLKVGIGEDNMSFKGVITCQHEIAHILGSTHDGEDAYFANENQPSAVGCPTTFGYIMSYQFGNHTKFYFSSCSIDQMKWNSRLPRAQCLHQGNGPFILSYNQTLPGQILTPDEQCKAYYFPDYNYFDNNGEEICSQLNCGFDDWFFHVFPAMEGTVCNKTVFKRCVDGRCVPFPSPVKAG